jgi:hypothetical protein|tara:strand:- start:285 stop:467 length:183 start_codon:yes stop_codon:yes gene_type:complete
LETSENKEWRSEFEGEIHYKTTNCDCGKVMTVRVNFHGSGDDNWRKPIKKKKRSIEDKVK